ncbi:MAG: asparagine synthase [Chloroflexi bacterium]|nr:MAG: asparagine synthase [Chloroflexota bacterium]
MDEMERYVTLLDAALEEAVVAALTQAAGARPALMYSAGVDSAVLARVCQDAGYTPLLIAVGTTRSKDREFVERSRPYLALPVRFIEIAEADIAAALPAVRDLLQEAGVTPDKMHLSLGVGTYLACQVASRQGIGLLLSAQGADSLFAGFYKHRSVPPDELPAVLERDVQNALRNDFARDRAIAASFGMRFAAPFLAPAVVGLALSIPVDLKLGPAGNKLILRALARRRGLPEFIAQRPKKAMQYSTGIQKIVERLKG